MTYDFLNPRQSSPVKQKEKKDFCCVVAVFPYNGRMTVTVAELIAKLEKLPQDATVQILTECHAHYETWVEWKNLDFNEYDVDDFSDIVRIGRKL